MRIPIGIQVAYFLFFFSCTRENLSHHYQLAEKFSSEGKHSIALLEFEKVILKDPWSSLGLEAMYQAGLLQSIYLSQFSDAIEKFRSYSARSENTEKVLDAQIRIGEILFSDLEHYEQAVEHYRSLLEKDFAQQKVPECLFRIAKSHFFLFQFLDAARVYGDLVRQYPESEWTERASFELGVSYFTGAKKEIQSTLYQDAIQAYERFVQAYPKSVYVPEAQFGIACCLEELGKMEEAIHIYHTLRKTYPSENVIQIKIARLQERITQHQGRY